MSSLQEDVAEARKAARALAGAVERLSRSHPDTLDLRRLSEDAARIGADLDLLAGDELSSSPAGIRLRRHDTNYDPREFGDGAYEDAGHRRK